MLTDHILEGLRELHLSAFAQALERQAEDPAQLQRPFSDRLGDLVEAERVARTDVRVGRLQRQAQLEGRPALDDIRYGARRGLDRALIEELAGCDWIRRHHNLVLVGRAQVGKTFLASALASEALKQNLSVAYFRTISLIELVGESDTAARRRLRNRLKKTRLLVLDEWAADTLLPEQGQLLRNLILDRKACGSTMLITRTPVVDWYPRMGDDDATDAILGRMAVGHTIEIKAPPKL